MKQLRIDKKALEALIKEELDEVMHSPAIDSGSVAIGQFGNCQVQILTTKDEFDHCDVHHGLLTVKGDTIEPGDEYLDEDGQKCVCIGYSQDGEYLIGEMVEHPGLPVALSIAKAELINKPKTEDKEKAS